MKINIDKLEKDIKCIQTLYNVTNKELGEIMGVDYAYIFRIMKNKDEEREYGSKLISGIENLCIKFNLNLENYIFFNKNVVK